MGSTRHSAPAPRAVDGVREQPPKALPRASRASRPAEKSEAAPGAVPFAFPLAEFAVDAFSSRSWELRGLVSWLLVVLGASVVALLGRVAPHAVSAVVVLFAVLLVLAFRPLAPPARVRVGADGVLVRWLWQRKFIPVADIAAVELDFSAEGFGAPSRARLVIRRKSGTTEDILVGGRPRGLDYHEGWQERRRFALDIQRRIESAVKGAAATATEPELRVLPPRGSKSSAQWIGELRDLLHQKGYRRQAAPALADLWRLVGDTSADPAERAAAAVVLGPTLDRKGRKRMRIVTATTAAPELHQALEAVAQGHDERLAAALDELALRDRAAKGD